MSTLELVLRTVAATASIILAAVLWRAHRGPLLGRLFGALFCLGVASYIPCSSTGSICAMPSGLPLAVLATAVPFLFWGWTRTVMDDEFKMTLAPLVFAAALIATPFITFLLADSQWGAIGIVSHSLLGIGFVLLALFEVLRSWRQDLIESRRRLRLVLIVVAGGYSIVVMTVELFLRDNPAAEALQLLNAGMLSVLLLGLSIGLVSMSDSFQAALGWEIPSQISKPAGIEVVQPTPRDLDGELLSKLSRAMTNNGMYKDASLSLTQLAQTVGVVERRLREIIHGQLGHKNFSSYVNAFRLEEVRLRLSDPRDDSTPILTIALDAGFGSIVAFNRAFKSEFGITPTAYRTQRQSSV